MAACLEGYRTGYRFASLARSEAIAQRITGEGLTCLVFPYDDSEDPCDSKEVELRPLGGRYLLNAEARAELMASEDFDVFEISEDGRLFRCFGNASSDNAIFITGRCNSSCIMCPDSDKARQRANIRDLADLLEQVRYIPSDAPHLTVTGGEPFMMGSDIFELFRSLSEKFTSTDFLLLTNGRILSLDSYCSELRRTLPRQATVGVPLHGYDACSHDRITQVEGSFDQTMEGLRNMLGLGMKVELRVVVSKISAKYIDRMAQLIVDELSDVHCVKVIGLEMLGSAAANRDAVWISYPEAFAKSKRAVRSFVLHGIDVGLYNFPLCAVDRGFWPLCEKSISDYKVRYSERCDACVERGECGGVFSGSLRFAEKDIEPIEVRE